MRANESRLKLALAGSADIMSWSYGRVATLESLDDRRIFGPSQDSRCECGKYAGAEFNGIICDRCGVRITENAAEARKRRLGHVQFERSCPHPLDDSVSIDAFPVAPIDFRRSADGSVNELGKKYEQLVKCGMELKKNLPPKEDYVSYYPALVRLDVSELREIMSGIIGFADGAEKPDRNTLYGLVSQSIRTLDPSFQTLLHCCAMVCDIGVAV
jgi:hypothetical protein